jgi:hypothetical protein
MAENRQIADSAQIFSLAARVLVDEDDRSIAKWGAEAAVQLRFRPPR